MYEKVIRPERIRAYLGPAGIIAFDFETSPLPLWRGEAAASLDAHTAKIVGVSLSVEPGSGIYIPLAHLAGENADPLTVIPLLRDLVWENPKVVKVAHNLAFEAMFLYAQTIVLQEPVYDTLAAAQLTLKAPGQYRKLMDCGLKTLVPELLGTDLPTFGQVTGGRFFDELDPDDPETVRYACADSDFALRLYYRLNDWFDTWLPRHRNIVEKLESPTAVYCGLMKYNGMPMDEAGMREKRRECEEKLIPLRAKLDEMTGGVKVGSNCSTGAFKSYLFKTLGLPCFKRTDKGLPAVDDESLQRLAEYCRVNRPELVPLFDLVQEYRKWGKLKSTYLDGFLKLINPASGRIHPDLMPLATETGRFACRNPNMQNCPRKTNDPVGIRAFIKAPEGKMLVSCDFSQIELRIGSFYCRDPKMLEVYRTGGDIHAQTTSVIYGIPYEQAVDKNNPDYKERRTVAKGVNFGLFYGLYAHGLQTQLTFKAGLKPTRRECKTILGSIRQGYPRLQIWQEETKQTAARRKYVETWLGRRRYLKNITSEDWGERSSAERCALNTPIQGTAADILKLAMARMLPGLAERPWLRPLLQIHDELVFEVPEDRVREAVAFIRECMEAKPFPELDVPLVAEAAVGPDFGHMKDLDD